MTALYGRVEKIIQIGLEDICNCFEINEDLFQIYGMNEKREDLREVIKSRASVNDWKKCTPLGGPGTFLNAFVLYCLVRHYGMTSALETGVSGGFYTSFILAALLKNTSPDFDGEMVSLELSDNNKEVAKLVPKSFRNTPFRWDLVMGSPSLDYFKKNRSHAFELYCHDSLHTMSYMTKELMEFKKSLSDRFIVFIDDQDSDLFWHRSLSSGRFLKDGYNVKYISGNESKLDGHLGGFILYEKA